MTALSRLLPRLRPLLIALVLIAGLATFAQSSSGQSMLGQATPAAPAAEQKPKGLLSIIPNDGVTWTIGVLSIVATTLIIQGIMRTRAATFIPPDAVNQMREMIANRQFKELIDFTETDPSFVAKALNPALKRAPSFNAMKEAMETSVGEQSADAFRRIEYLNIIGNLGPLLGLLGTVLGMIQAFSAMQAAGGTANPAQLAGGISTALAHTFLGLFLALPCLATFGILRTLTDRFTVRASLVAEELLLMTKPPEGKPAMPVTPVAPAPAVSRPAIIK